MKDFIVKIFGEYFKSTKKKEKLSAKFCEEQNIRKLCESFYIFLTTPDEVENMLRWCNQILLIIVYILNIEILNKSKHQALHRKWKIHLAKIGLLLK